MADRPGPHDDSAATDPRLALAARHALHDEELVSFYATDGEAAEGADQARALVERCATCRDLHADLVAITAAVRSLDDAATAAAYIKAPRDFRLPVEGGRALRPAGLLDRVAAAFAGAIASFGRPLGATLATFGVVGLLVGSAALSPLGYMASGPGGGSSTEAPPGNQEGTVGNQSAATSEPDRMTIQTAPDTSARDLSSPKVVAPYDDASSGPAAISWLFAGSIAAVVLGAALLLAGGRSRNRRVSVTNP